MHRFVLAIVLTYCQLAAGQASVPTTACTPVPEGAIAWWPGESNTWDVVGGYDGQFYPPLELFYPTGKVGSALRFVGSQYVVVTTGGGLTAGTNGSLTIEGWVRPEQNTVMPIAEWNDGRGSVGAGLLLGGGGPGVLEATLTDTNAPARTVTLRSSPGAANLLEWQHVALTYDNDSGIATIYLNGAVAARTNVGSMMPNTSGDFYLGYRRSGQYAGAHFFGGLDEVTLYNRALAPEEVQSIVDANDAGKCPPPMSCLPPPRGIAAWWRGESNALDSVALNNGEIYPPTFPPTLSFSQGRIGTGFDFRGVNYWTVPPSDTLDVGPADGLTVEAWVRIGAMTPAPLIEWTDGATFGPSLWLSYYRGPTVLEANLIDTAGGFHLLQSPLNTLYPNIWQHVAVTYEKSSGLGVLYVNGNPVAQTNLGSFTPRTDTTLQLGHHPPNRAVSGYGAPPASERRFYGAMDEIALYRRALNAVEIRAIARSRAGKCLELPPTIGRQPRDQIALEGKDALMEVTAGGSDPLSYQWYFEGVALPRANAASLRFGRVNSAQMGTYSVVISNVFGSVTSCPALLTVLPADQCLPPANGAVAWWKGENNEWDVFEAHDATWGPPSLSGFTDGVVGDAFYMTLGNHLEVPADPELDVGNGLGFTVEGWIRPQNALAREPIVDWNDGTGVVGVGLMQSQTGPGTLDVTLTDPNALYTLDRIVTLSSPPFSIGSPTNPAPDWSHVAVTFDRGSGQVRLLVNGVIVAERTIAPILTRITPGTPVPFTPATTGDLYFGWRRSGLYAGLRFFGAMDEMTVYDHALSATEIQAIYVVGAKGKCSPPPPTCLPAVPELVGWWRGESNTLDSVQDNPGVLQPVGFPTDLSYSPARIGAGFSLKGLNYLVVPSAASLDVGTGPGLTLEAWINPSQFRPQPIVEWNTGGGTAGVGLSYSFTGGVGTLEANLVDADGLSHQVFSPHNTVGVNRWQHVAVTYDRTSGVATLYYGGSPVVQTNLGTFTLRTDSDLYFGYRPPGPYLGSGSRFVGTIDEVALYRRALSAEEILASSRTRIGKCTDRPTVIVQVASQRVNAGMDVTLSPVVQGNPLLHYQWFKNQTPLSGAVLQELKLVAVGKRDEGQYFFTVTNHFGSTTSSNAWLQVNYPPVADASATPTPLILPACTNRMTAVLDGSRSSDPDADPLDYRWSLSTTGVLLGTGRVAVVTLPAGIYAVELEVDDGLLTDTNHFTLEILTTAQALENLVAHVKDSGWQRQQSLLASLNAALASVGRSDPIPAVNQLEAFQNKLLAQVASSDPELAEAFRRDSQAVLDALRTCDEQSARPPGRLMAHPSHRTLQVTFEGVPGRLYIVEASNDMVTWERIGTAKNRGNGRFEFEDPKAGQDPHRFYRVVTP